MLSITSEIGVGIRDRFKEFVETSVRLERSGERESEDRHRLDSSGGRESGYAILGFASSGNFVSFAGVVAVTSLEIWTTREMSKTGMKPENSQLVKNRNEIKSTSNDSTNPNVIRPPTTLLPPIHPHPLSGPSIPPHPESPFPFPLFRISHELINPFLILLRFV